MTPQDFLLNFPEFRETDKDLVAAALNRAAAEMGGPDFSVWGNFATPTPPTPWSNPQQGGGPTVPTQADLAHGNMAAHILVSSPFGTEMRLAPGGSGRSSYLEAFERIMFARCGGIGVAGVVI